MAPLSFKKLQNRGGEAGGLVSPDLAPAVDKRGFTPAPQGFPPIKPKTK